MEPHSILAGKSYRTADNEVRRVVAIENDEVVFHAVARTPGVIARHEDQRLDLARFADEAQGEVAAG